MKRRPLVSIVRCFVVISICAAQTSADVRFRVRHTGGGVRTSETVTYLKGVRQRDEFTGARGRNGRMIDGAFIHQCDLKRLVRLDVTNRVYSIITLDFRNNEEAIAYYETQAAQPGSSYARLLERSRAQLEKLPAITATTTIVDTGERREMFGYTARHIKTVTTWKAPREESCALNDAKLETDGWYIDLLYGLQCSSDISGDMSAYPTFVQFSGLPPGKCGERVAKEKYRLQRETVGASRFGFPLMLTKRMQDEKNRVLILTHEVIELSNEELNANLFEVPADYTEVPVERARE